MCVGLVSKCPVLIGNVWGLVWEAKKDQGKDENFEKIGQRNKGSRHSLCLSQWGAGF